MFVTDHLSRASLSNVDVDDKELQVFSMELEDVRPFNTIAIHQLQRATEQDPELQTPKTVTQSGWPQSRSDVPDCIKQYWNYREELSIHDGVVFKNQQ